MMSELPKNQAFNNIMNLMTSIFVSGSIGFILISCAPNGDGGPISAQHSASIPENVALNPAIASNSSETRQARQEDSLASPPSDATAGLTSDQSYDFSEESPSLPEDNQTDAVPLTTTGVDVQVTWNTSSDPNARGYNVYYGKQPSGELGSCSYGESQPVDAPPATITGLEPNTPYYFAISAFNEAESPCSIEFMMVTPPANS